jgi:small subunit ribosomal protein SAe
MEGEKGKAIRQMLAARVMNGSDNVSFGMQPYVFQRRRDGSHVINIGMTYEKIKFAARIIAAVDEPKDVLAISAKPYGQRAVHKFAQFTGALCINQRFTPGYFTNHSIKDKYIEPRVIIVCDPNTDQQAVHEAAYANIPCIALCDTDAHLEYVDCVIPCNTKNKSSIGHVMWLLTREVLRLRNQLPMTKEWEVLPDLFFFRDAQDEKQIADMIEDEESGEAPQAAPAAEQGLDKVDVGRGKEDDWDNAGNEDKW